MKNLNTWPEEYSAPTTQETLRSEGFPSIYKAYEMLSSDSLCRPVDMAKFSMSSGGIYSDTEVQSDLNKVAKRKKEIQEGATSKEDGMRMISEVLGKLLSHLAEVNKWLGPNVHIVQASLFDDFFNGVDCIADFETREEHLAFAVDATTAKDISTIRKKIAIIRKNIESGRMAEVKYSSDENGKSQKPLRNIPHIIIGADRRMVDDVSELLLNETKNLSKIAFHPLMFVILDQTRAQLKMFGEFAKKNNKDDIARHYETIYTLIDEIIKKKELAIEKAGAGNVHKLRTKANEDKVLHKIISVLGQELAVVV